MKKNYLHLLLFVVTMVSFYSKATIITAVNGPGTENWGVAGTWDLGREPICGDTIVIPAGITVHIPANVDLDDPANLACGQTHIIVGGHITLATGNRFELAAGVCIDFLDENADLTAVGAGKGNALVSIGGVTEWQKVDGPWVGPDNIGCSNSLPVELMDFSLQILTNHVELNFTTASERDLDYFVIECSRDGSYWQEVTTINSTGNSSSKTTYSAKDDSPFNGVSYYRLKNINTDGGVNTLEIISCEYYSVKFLLYPIPVNKIMFLEGEKLSQSDITVVNNVGDIVEVEMTPMGDKYSFDFEPIKSGVYFLQIQNDRIKKTERIVVVHK